jgi:hypothetical protein
MMFVVIMVECRRIMKLLIMTKMQLVIRSGRDIIDVKDDWKRIIMVL